MTSESEDTSSFSIVKLVDENIRYIKYPFFGAGIVGVVLIARSVRVGTKFTRVRDIPEEFFKKQFTLHGKITEVCKGSTATGSNSNTVKEHALTVLVDHVPILNLPSFMKKYVQRTNASSGLSGSNKYIRVTIPGLEIKTQFYYDIQSKLLGQRASMILMDRSQDLEIAYGLANLRCYKFKVFPTYENVGFWCVENGFGAATAIPHSAEFTNSKKFNAYYSKLLRLEEKAVRKRKGMWKNDPAEASRQSVFINWLRRLLNYMSIWKKR